MNEVIIKKCKVMLLDTSNKKYKIKYVAIDDNNAFNLNDESFAFSNLLKQYNDGFIIISLTFYSSELDEFCKSLKRLENDIKQLGLGYRKMLKGYLNILNYETQNVSGIIIAISYSKDKYSEYQFCDLIINLCYKHNFKISNICFPKLTDGCFCITNDKCELIYKYENVKLLNKDDELDFELKEIKYLSNKYFGRQIPPRPWFGGNINFDPSSGCWLKKR